MGPNTFILFVLLIATGAGVIVFLPKLIRVHRVMHLFDADKIDRNFKTMHHIFNAREIRASDQPFQFPKGETKTLPEEFSCDGKVFKSSDYLDLSYTKGIIVIQNDHLVFEKYYSGSSESTQHISWSRAKSVVSALFGIAMEEGYIRSLDQTVEEYLPRLRGSAYDGVRIKDVLQMSTGVRFNEDYGAFFSDINKWGRRFALGLSQDKFAATLKREEEPGTRHHYVSINTHVLGMIIVKATGKSLSEYLEEKLWGPMGMEYNACWLCDDAGMEVALGGLNAALRDYAKIGQLYLDRGVWKGVQIVPREWCMASVTPDAKHLLPENNKLFGYGYQWWIPKGNEGEFLAMGVYSQYIYVNPVTRTVIAVNSANHRFNEEGNPYADPKVFLELFRTIARQANL